MCEWNSFTAEREMVLYQNIDIKLGKQPVQQVDIHLRVHVSNHTIEHRPKKQKGSERKLILDNRPFILVRLIFKHFFLFQIITHIDRAFNNDKNQRNLHIYLYEYFLPDYITPVMV